MLCFSRVSVMRGQVLTPQGLGIIGIRVSVDRDTRFGFTLTRQGGWYVCAVSTMSHLKNNIIILIHKYRFDVLVNGGGAVVLQFQRSPFKRLIRTVFAPWNQIVVLPPVYMELDDSIRSEPGFVLKMCYPYIIHITCLTHFNTFIEYNPIIIPDSGASSDSRHQSFHVALNLVLLTIMNYFHRDLPAHGHHILSAVNLVVA